LIVPNVSESLYSRLWCVAELHKAMKLELASGTSLIHVAKDPVPFSKSGVRSGGISAMIADATCSDDDDKMRIKDYIRGHEVEIESMIQALARRARDKEEALLESKGEETMRVESAMQEAARDNAKAAEAEVEFGEASDFAAEEAMHSLLSSAARCETAGSTSFFPEPLNQRQVAASINGAKCAAANSGTAANINGTAATINSTAPNINRAG